jgi:hypothetical protein
MWKFYAVVISQDFIKFWGKIFAFVLLVFIEIPSGFKILSLFKVLLKNLFQTFICFLENFLGKTKYQIIIFYFYSDLCKLCLQRNDLQKVLCLVKIAFSTLSLNVNQTLFL